MTEQTDAQVRWQTTPRPLNFVRIRLERGGQAEFIRSVLETTKTVLLDKLGQLREDGLPEDDPEIEEVTRKLRWTIRAVGDLDYGIIELQPDPARVR